MFLNEFADDLAPKDMRGSGEARSLLESAADLGIPHGVAVRYVSRQTVLRGMRFHFTEWGDPRARRRIRRAPRRGSRALRRSVGHLVTVPDVGHNVHGDNTPGCLEAIAPFLASLD